MSQDTERLGRLVADLETRLTTDIAVLRSLIRDRDPDSPDVRRAQEMLDAFTRMLDGLR